MTGLAWINAPSVKAVHVDSRASFLVEDIDNSPLDVLAHTINLATY
jgi:hypothetical protein